MQKAHFTRTENPPDPPVPTRAIVLYASDGDKVQEQLTTGLRHHVSQVDGILMRAAGNLAKEYAGWPEDGYDGVVVVVTEDLLKIPHIGAFLAGFKALHPRFLRAAVHWSATTNPRELGPRFGMVLPSADARLDSRKDPWAALDDAAETIGLAIVKNALSHRESAAAKADTGDASQDTSPESAIDFIVRRHVLAPPTRWLIERGFDADTEDTRPRTAADLLLAILAAGNTERDPLWGADWLARQVSVSVLGPPAEVDASALVSAELHPPLSTDVIHLLDRARDIAQRTSRTPRIHTRHLLGALLTDTDEDDPARLRSFPEADPDLDELRALLLEFVRGDEDIDSEWERVLFGDAGAALRLLSFNADSSRSEDYLNIRGDVRAFAGLIAARTLTPPLSIGLFGEWGSGKTFFMRMLRREVDGLARQAEASGQMQRDLPFWKRIVQIEFNAWHYVEGNLWASLVQHIFDNLRFADEPQLSASQELQQHLLRELKTETQAEQKATRETEAAEQQVRDAGAAVEQARIAFDQKASELAALSRATVLADLPVPEIRAQVDSALTALGLDTVGTSARDMQAALSEAHALLGRGRAVLAPLLFDEQGSRRRRWRHLLLALLAGPAVGLVVGVVMAWLGPDGVATISAWATAAAALLVTVTRWLRARVEEMEPWVRDIELAQRQLDEQSARAQAQNAENVRRAEEQLRLREADYAAARRREEQARQKAAEARQRLAEASLAGVLSNFVEDRAASTDYRKHLGTLALVRNDFERLSALIEEENWRLVPEIPNESLKGRGLEKFTSLDDERRDRARRINRIVLYIDDLDRCPPAKVVEVLQAVHLLLAFPLFVVVVGVDARWITRSLETRYREMLSTDVPAGRRDTDEFREIFGAATAHDYLEKIFQVPFWLRPMNDGAARQMVSGLLAPSLVTDPAAEAGTTATEDGSKSSGTSDSSAGELSTPAESSGLDAETAAEMKPGAALTADGNESVAQQETKDTASATVPDLAPESLEIRESELAFMNALAPLLGRSPRALKRFVNVYRLIKAGLSAHERRGFVPDDGGAGDCQCVLFLLAVDTGAPKEASGVFRAIRAGYPPQKSDNAPQRLDQLVQDAPLTGTWLAKHVSEYPQLNDAVRLARWIPRVSRFSFHTGRVDGPAPPFESEPEPRQST